MKCHPHLSVWLTRTIFQSHLARMSHTTLRKPRWSPSGSCRRAIDGCNFANKWNDPLGCQYTNIYNPVQNSNIDFTVASYSNTISKFKGLAELNIGTSINYNKGTNFIGLTASNDNNLNEIINQTSSFILFSFCLIYYM